MKQFSIALITLFISTLTFGQSYTIPTSPSLTYLYNSKNEIPVIGHTEKMKLFEPKLNNWRARFKLIKNKSGLYVLVDGTGHVYKATNLDQKNITFTRIDSTQFIGYNFESINFSYKDKIYSFGGYGFWNRNGQLIHFTDGGEWMIDKINKTYKTMNMFYTFKLSESKIYYVEFPWNEETSLENNINTNVIEFNIEKKENKLLGKLNSKINLNYKVLLLDIPSLNGKLNLIDSEIFLCNFSSNKVYRLINSKIKDALIGIAGAELQTTFEDEGKVYYSFTNNTTLRSFFISMNDFEEEPYSFYIPEQNKISKLIIIISMCFITLLTTLFIFYKKRRKETQTGISENIEPYSADLKSNELSMIEVTIIKKLIEKSNMDSHLTVDEFNSLLGIKRKTIEIQKRVRTEAINRINHKFNVNFNLETVFIERTRSDDDRRYFNYIINKENSNIYLNNSISTLS